MINKESEKVLVLSGGASKGIYQVGVLKALVENGYRWDTVAGVSVGSINAFFLSHFKKEEQHEAVLALEKLWKTEIVNSKSIYKPWSFFWLINHIIAFKKNGVFNTEPLKKLLEKHYNSTKLMDSGVNLILGAFSITTGNYVSIIGNNITNIVDWVMASSSYPFAFPPVKIFGELYTDGGIKDYVPVIDVLNFCEPKEITVILTKPLYEHVPYKKPEQINNMIKFGARTIETFSDKITCFDNVSHLCDMNNIKLNIFAPDSYLSYNNKQIESLDFDPKKMNFVFEQGYHETLNKLK